MDFGSTFALCKTVNPAAEYEEIDETDYSAGLHSAMEANVNSRGDNVCLLDIIDTAGQEEYSSMRHQYMQQAHAYMIVYSISSRESFKEAQAILQFCRRYHKTGSISAILVGNKSDLAFQRVVTEHEARNWANSVGIPWLECSAKTGMNVDRAFRKLVQITPRTGVEYKIAVLGGGGVGKSAITTQFVLDCFVESYDPTIEDTFRKQIIVDNLPPMRNVSTAKSSLALASSGFSDRSEKRSSGTVSKIAKRSSGFFSSLFRSVSQRSSSSSSRNEAPPTYNEAATTTVVDKSSGIVKKVRRVPKRDTNILLLNLGSLSPENFDKLEIKKLDMPPPSCSQCSAVLSNTPTCLFCEKYHTNISQDQLHVRRAAEEYTLVQGNNDYATENMSTLLAYSDDRGLVVFCIDISGSMSLTHRVNSMQTMWQSIKLQKGSSGSQVQQPESEYVTRLQCIQEAMRVHFDRLEKQFPHRKVAIIAFHSHLEVFIGSEFKTYTIDPNNINDIEEGMDAANIVVNSEAAQKWKSVGENVKDLRKYTDSLTTRGATALGPALAVALGFARYHKKSTSASSEIFLCTDGASNTGIGSTEYQLTTSSHHGRAFYSRAGEYAVAQSAKINIIGIDGEGVALEILEVAARISGGLVNTVTPDELRREIRTASQRRFIAKNVTVKLHAPKEWHFVADPRPGVTISKNQLTYTVSQVDDEMGIGFAYAINNTSNSKGHALAGTIPFQAQITYTSTKTGSVNVCVLNKVIPVTADRDHAEAATEVALVGTYVLQRTAFEANQILVKNLSFGDTAKTQLRGLRDALYANHQLLIRAAKTNTQQEELGNFIHETSQLDEELNGLMSRGAYGASRDQAARLFARMTALPRNALLAGNKRIGQVKRREVVK